MQPRKINVYGESNAAGHFFFWGKKEREKSKSLDYPVGFFFPSLLFSTGEGQTLTEFQMANTSCPITELWVPSCPID